MSKTRNPDALIRIEDAIKVLCWETCCPGVCCPDGYCAKMWDEFEEVERVDAIPVVRCRNCMNWIPGYITDTDDLIPPKCGKYHQMVGHSSDDFCSLGERKDSDHETE